MRRSYAQTGAIGQSGGHLALDAARGGGLKMTTRDGIIALMLMGACGLAPASSPGAAGTAKEHDACGGSAGVMCDPGLFCDVAGPCDAEAPPGVCIKLPVACTKERKPVCGCNGVTY